MSLNGMDLNTIRERQEALAAIKSQLKSEFFGLDPIIDRVVDSVYAWYLFPQLITRPVVVNLWGMTGVGKTQLVRRLSALLGFTDKYVEIQMDGFSQGSGFLQSSISSILRGSSIEEKTPGILLLDEIQRFRTVDEQGSDVKVERYQDVWMLLSDGKFSADHSLFRDIEDILNRHLWQEDARNGGDEDEDDDETDLEAVLAGRSKKSKKPRAPRKFKISPWEAENVKRTLKLSETIEEIMQWDAQYIQSRALEIRNASHKSWEEDYSKLLIFISGNLDEAFSSATNAEDCDTDADVYHDLTSKISQMEIKAALKQRFRPEQISRLGNNHIIYPSLSKDSYQRLIKHSCDKYIGEMTAISGLEITVDPSVLQEIYENSVYPTQGTRPVFSSVHKIFSSALSNFAVWAIENSLSGFEITILPEEGVLVALNGKQECSVPVDLDVRDKRSKNSQDFNTLVAVHEAGHALVYSVLSQQAPKEVKINLASFKGGYMVRNHQEGITSKSQTEDSISVCMAGQAAEQVIFGTPLTSSGSGSDIARATSIAADYFRKLGMGSWSSKLGYDNSHDPNHTNTHVEDTDRDIEELVRRGKDKAKSLIVKHRELFREIVNTLLEVKTLDQEAFTKLVNNRLVLHEEDPGGGYSEAWKRECDGV